MALPDKDAYVYLDQRTGPARCTYAELRQRAHAVGARLRETGQKGERVLLLYPPGLDFIDGLLGCLSAGVTAVPAPPPNPLKPERSLARLQSIVKSAQPTFALTTSAVLQAIRPAVADDPAFAGLTWLATDEIPAGAAELDLHDTGGVALIQYTSGSTSEPKGATLTHENLLHNVGYFDDGWDHSPESVCVNWLPAFHDLGLVYGILTPLWGGFLGVQLSPIDVIQRPLCWLQAITSFRATHSTGPNFIYELCARKVRDDDIPGLDLTSWRTALTAAEPVRAETMARFAARFARAGFRASAFSPGFGLSEGTCKVTAVPSNEAPSVLHLRDAALEQNLVELAPPGPGTRAVVGCGRPGRGVGVVIVDPETLTPCEAGQVGEIWVSGPSVAHSYWGRPEATEAELRARLAGDGDTAYLRTGDLGFLHDGQLFITGRIKDLIIIRGANHYPQDLEYTAQDACPNIRPGCVAVCSYEDEGERVAVVAEVEAGRGRTLSAEETIASIRGAISEAHGLSVARVELIRAGTLPKTTSGKIQRLACKRALLAGELRSVAAG